MKKDTLTYYGWCPKCHHYHARDARVLIEEMADEHCPECGSQLEFQTVVHRHPAFRGKGSRYFLFAIGILLVLCIGMAAFVSIRLHQSPSGETIISAKKVTERMTIPEIINAFHEEGIKEELLASILHSSPFTFRRFLSGESVPTPSMEETIRGLYEDYLVLRRNKLLFFCRYRKNGADQFYCFPNPLQEQIAEGPGGRKLLENIAPVKSLIQTTE